MVLKVEGLVYRYASALPPVLNAIDLTLAKGEMLCLLGPNGTGKTTLLRCLIGAVRAECGTVHIDGENIDDSPATSAKNGLCAAGRR
jgi:ABC-type branched-subunit amino acid transport system ATPase component